jgi:hypothetical protein
VLHIFVCLKHVKDNYRYDVPQSVHSTLKSRAVHEDMSPMPMDNFCGDSTGLLSESRAQAQGPALPGELRVEQTLITRALRKADHLEPASAV